MNNFKVSFFKTPPKDSDDKEEFLGSIVVDDHGVGIDLTITAKAFRVASPGVLSANKVIVQKV